MIFMTMRREKDVDKREIMRKFTFKGVLDNFPNFRTAVSQSLKPDEDLDGRLRPEDFQVMKTFLHGFPFQPTAIAYDPVQKLLAVGSKCGSLRILGQPGVDVHIQHSPHFSIGTISIIHLQFLINEGALVSATADDALHLWNFKQKLPQIVQSLKFQKERITFLHLPLQSRWLYVGSEKGNVHIVQLENFSLSGYIINWNKAIEFSRKTHPGAIVHLSDNPTDNNKLLLGYDSGLIVLWDLKNKIAEMRWQTSELRSITWHYEGKLFMCAHIDGTLSTWSARNNLKAVCVSQPHATNKEVKQDECKPINKVDWICSKSGEAFVIFSGGMPDSQTPSITVIHNKTTTVLEMEHKVIDYIILCESPFTSDLQEPYAIIALLQNDLVVMDLQVSGYPCLENPYPMDLHEAIITCCLYIADCPADLIPAFYSVGRASTNKKLGFSEKDWPITGGNWVTPSCGYNELILTGHADGSIKIWDASAGTLQVLYKLKTTKLFEKIKPTSIDIDQDPLSIELLSFCPISRLLCVATAFGHVIQFTFAKSETSENIAILEIPILLETSDETNSPDYVFAGIEETNDDSYSIKMEYELKVKIGPQKKTPGFQAHLVCQNLFNNKEKLGHVTALTINSFYGLMSYGYESHIVIVDIEHKLCLLSMAICELYTMHDLNIKLSKSSRHEPLHLGESSTNLGEELQGLNISIDQNNGSSGISTAHSSGSTCSEHLSRLQDKQDLSITRSSSSNSIQSINQDDIQCITFASCCMKRSDATVLVPTLWIGTSSGSVIPFLFSLPDCDSSLIESPKVLQADSTIFRIQGSIISVSVLDLNGILNPCIFDSVKDKKKIYERYPVLTKTNTILEETKLDSNGDRQFITIASEKQARVIGLPSHTCLYRQQLADSDFVVKVECVFFKDNLCLVSYTSSGHLGMYSLPTLKLLFDVDFLPLNELSFQMHSNKGIVDPMLSIWGQQLIVNEDTNLIAKTFCLSNKGLGLYLKSPSEIQKFTFSREFCMDLAEMACKLFIPMDMPEVPKEGFFKGIFGSGVKSLDRDELFGNASGKPNKSIAKHINSNEMENRVCCATGEINRAQKMLIERGDKLNRLEENAEQLRNEAENFALTSHELMLKYKDKKWYQL